MTDYLNRADKEVVVMLAGCVGMTDTLSDLKFRHSDEVREELVALRDLAQSIINQIIDGVDPDQATGILRFANNSELMVMPKSDVRTQTEWCVVEKEDIKTIIEDVVSDCAFCDKDGKDVKNCKLRKALLKCGLVSADNSVMKDKSVDCPFKG